MTPTELQALNERLASLTADAKQLSPADRERVLRARAAQHAEPQRDAEDESGLEVIVLRRGAVRFGIPTAALVVVSEVSFTPLPHANHTVVGLFLLRGRVRSLIDPLPVLGGAVGDDLPAHGLVALVQVGRRGIGLRVDEVLGPRHLRDSDHDGSPQSEHSAAVDQVTRDGVVLHAKRLVTLPQVIIDVGR